MWFKVDDQMPDHRKIRGLDPAAIGLWTLAGAWCGANGTDGFVPESVLVRWARSWRKLSALLVARGLWEPCEVDGERGWRFHDWSEWQPTRDQAKLPIERLRWRRAKALQRDRELCEAIVARDRCRCRYCGVRVRFADKRGSRGGTYDHVDPDGQNTLANVVVACRRCNGRKADRTPEEAGMTLLPVPGPDLAPAESGPNTDSVQAQPEPGPPRARTRGGTGQIGSESEPGRAGSGPGPEDEGAAA